MEFFVILHRQITTDMEDFLEYLNIRYTAGCRSGNRKRTAGRILDAAAGGDDDVSVIQYKKCIVSPGRDRRSER